MSQSELSTQELLERVAFRPPAMLKAAITIDSPARPSKILRPPNTGPGSLKALPLEILHHILCFLDFQSLSRLIWTSNSTKHVVESLPAYKELMTHAPEALTALGYTNLLKHHSALQLRAALRSESCVSCGKFGEYLHLPTCERCCYSCLQLDPSRWVAPVSLAKACFELPQELMDKVPKMKSIPGTYFVGQFGEEELVLRGNSETLVSIGAAKSLAQDLYGPTAKFLIDRTRDPAERVYPQPLSANYTLFRGSRISTLYEGQHIPNYRKNLSGRDKFQGLASILFPSLTGEDCVDPGHWCHGCRVAMVDLRSGPLQKKAEVLNIPMLSQHPVIEIVVRCYIFSILKQRRAWSRAGLLEHIKGCHGAQKFLKSKEDMKFYFTPLYLDPDLKESRESMEKTARRSLYQRRLSSGSKNCIQGSLSLNKSRPTASPSSNPESVLVDRESGVVPRTFVTSAGDFVSQLAF